MLPPISSKAAEREHADSRHGKADSCSGLSLRSLLIRRDCNDSGTSSKPRHELDVPTPWNVSSGIDRICLGAEASCNRSPALFAKRKVFVYRQIGTTTSS